MGRAVSFILIGPDPMKATIVIASKDRKTELAAALRSAERQIPRPEIIVIDDGSTDGTAEMVRAEFPGVILKRFDESGGYVVRRNQAARMTSSDVVLSMDDDAEFSAQNIVQHTLIEFSHPAVGAVAIPFIDTRKDEHLRQKAPDKRGIWITDAYVGTAHAVRRDVFLSLGGYREEIVHQGEEMDLCIRMLEAGYLVRMGNAAPILHHESERRDFSRMDYFGARNAVLFAWQNCPAVFLLMHLAVTTLRCLVWTMKRGRLRVRVRGVIAGYASMGRHMRRPVSVRTYLMFRSLKKRGPTELGDLTDTLLPVRPVADR